MGRLQLASEESKRIDLGEGDFLDVRTDVSKKVFNQLMLAMPRREITEESGLTPQEGVDFARALFEALVLGWSLPVDATVDNYDNLKVEAASVVDEALIEHFGEVTATKDELSKVSTSQGKQRKGSTQA